MSTHDFYSYKKIEDAMYSGVVNTLDKIRDNKPDAFCSVMEFKKQVFDHMCESDEKIKEIFAKRQWAKPVLLGIAKDGTKVMGIAVDGYLESTYENVMDRFNERDHDIAVFLDEWEDTVEGFFRANLGIDSYISDEEYEAAKKKVSKLVAKFAKLKGTRPMQTRMMMPSFDTPVDTVDWLEREIVKLEE